MWRPLAGQPGTGVPGVVYLLAFDSPVGHARHYRGWSAGDPSGWIPGLRSDSDPGLLPARLRSHARGSGSRLVAIASSRGTGWTLASAVPGDRHEERRRKNCGSYARRDCMFCSAGSPHPGPDQEGT